MKLTHGTNGMVFKPLFNAFSMEKMRTNKQLNLFPLSKVDIANYATLLLPLLLPLLTHFVAITLLRQIVHLLPGQSVGVLVLFLLHYFDHSVEICTALFPVIALTFLNIFELEQQVSQLVEAVVPPQHTLVEKYLLVKSLIVRLVFSPGHLVHD